MFSTEWCKLLNVSVWKYSWEVWAEPGVLLYVVLHCLHHHAGFLLVYSLLKVGNKQLISKFNYSKSFKHLLSMLDQLRVVKLLTSSSSYFQSQHCCSCRRNHLLLSLSSLQFHGGLGGGVGAQCQDSLKSCVQHCIWVWLRLLQSLRRVWSGSSVEQHLDQSSVWWPLLTGWLHVDDDPGLSHLRCLDVVHWGCVSRRVWSS